MKDWYNSPDGKYFAYLVSESNSDFGTWYIRQIDTPLVKATLFPLGGEGHLPNDVLPNSYGSFRWSKDSTGAFYVHATDDGSIVSYHRLGISSENDTTIIQPDGSENSWSLMLSTDGTWLVLKGVKDVLGQSKVYATYLPGQTLSDKMKWISVAPSYDFTVNPINVVNEWLYLGTNRNALNGKIAKAKLDWSKARETKNVSTLTDRLDFVDVVPTQESATLYSDVVLSKDLAVIIYIKMARYVVQILELETGKFLHTAIPNDPSQVTSITSALHGTSVTIGVSGTTSPRSLYDIRCNGSSFEDVLLTVQKINGTDPKDYITEQLFATSMDGTQVSYSIVYKNNTPKTGNCTAWIHAYGNYGKIETFFFNPTYFSWLVGYECTFFVWASVRGGGDLGQEWHIAGQLHNKTKTIEDVVAIAQDLVIRKIVGKGQIIADGISAGGMVVAAAANKAPEGTFGVVLPKRAVLDYFLRVRSPGGTGQFGEFGDPNNPQDFDTIIDWSPLHNINKTKDYPTVLVIPGDSDDRVIAAHSFKFLAQIQADRPNNTNPLLMHLVKSAGHTTAGLSTQNAINEGLHQLCVISLTLQQKSIS